MKNISMLKHFSLLFTVLFMLSGLLVSCNKQEKETSQAKSQDNALESVNPKASNSIEDVISYIKQKTQDNFTVLNVYYEMGKYKEAVEYYNEIENPDISSKLIAAYIYYILKEYQKAFDLFQEISTQNQDIILAKYYLGTMYFSGLCTKQDYQKAFELFEYCANRGNVSAKILLMEYYYLVGLGNKQDYKKSFDLSKELADKGNLRAKSLLIINYLSGIGTERNIEKAVELYNTMEEYADKSLTDKIADIYYLGVGNIKQNHNKAFDIYSKAAKKGSLYSKNMLSFMYYMGDGVEQDYKKSFELSKEAVEQGFWKANEILAVNYCSNKSVKLDLQKAADCFIAIENKANENKQLLKLSKQIFDVQNNKFNSKEIEEIENKSKHGDAQAQYQLACLYYYGIGVKHDINKSFELFNKLAQQGDEKSLFQAGTMYLYGLGTKQDYQKAYEYYQKAADKGNCYAEYNLGTIYLSGTEGIKRNFQIGLEYFQKAAEKGLGDAQSYLGNVYFYGIGTEPNIKKAVEYFQKAAEQRYGEAQYFIGCCYLNGLGLEQNSQKANEYFQKAAEQGDDKAQFECFKTCFRENNQIKAFEYLNKAAINGNVEAQYYLGQTYKQNIKYKRAFEYFEKAAYQGYDIAQFALSRLYKIAADNIQYSEGKGFVIPGVDLEECRNRENKFLQISAEQGHYEAQKELAKKYLLDVKNGGFGFDRNKSMELMKQAAVNGDIYAQNFILKAEKSSK